MKSPLLYLMSLLYLLAGLNHFWHPQTYLNIMPPWLPAPLLLVYLSGACEMAVALLLIPRSTRVFAAWLLVALLIAVFPANIQMMINFARADSPYLWLAILRLPLQLLLIWWAWCYTKPVREKIKRR